MSPKERTFVIAEAGVNHNGSLDLARRLVDAAAEARADAVKFQTFRADAIISRRAPKADYQIRTTGHADSQLEMVRKLELSEEHHDVLIAHAAKRGIRFLSSPFDLASLELLTQRFGLDTIKVPSGEITNAPFLVEVARSGRKVILSTGMSSLSEVETALGALAFGYVDRGGGATAGRQAFMAAFAGEDGQRALREHVSLLHCTSEYPAPAAEANLRAIDTLSTAFGLAVGLSDHTRGIHIPIAAVARGARIIEKHFTVDRSLPGPDHAASLEPAELAAMIASIRDVEAALGDGVKRPVSSELANRDIARKSLVAACAIAAGERLGPDNIAIKRPGTGISPLLYWEQCGRVADRDYAQDELLDPPGTIPGTPR